MDAAAPASASGVPARTPPQSERRTHPRSRVSQSAYVRRRAAYAQSHRRGNKPQDCVAQAATLIAHLWRRQSLGMRAVIALVAVACAHMTLPGGVWNAVCHTWFLVWHQLVVLKAVVFVLPLGWEELSMQCLVGNALNMLFVALCLAIAAGTRGRWEPLLYKPFGGGLSVTLRVDALRHFAFPHDGCGQRVLAAVLGTALLDHLVITASSPDVGTSLVAVEALRIGAVATTAVVILAAFMAQSRHVAWIASVVACFTEAVLRVYQSWPHGDVAASPITIARVCAMLPLASLGVGAIALCPAVVSAWLVRRVFPRRNLAMQALLATEMRLCICAVATIGSLRSAKAMTFHARLLAADLVPVATATVVMLALTGVVVVGGAAAFGHRAMERLNSVVAARFLFSGVRIADVRVRGLQGVAAWDILTKLRSLGSASIWSWARPVYQLLSTVVATHFRVKRQGHLQASVVCILAVSDTPRASAITLPPMRMELTWARPGLPDVAVGHVSTADPIVVKPRATAVKTKVTVALRGYGEMLARAAAAASATGSGVTDDEEAHRGLYGETAPDPDGEPTSSCSELRAVLKVGLGDGMQYVVVPLASFRRGKLALSPAVASVMDLWGAMWYAAQVDGALDRLCNGRLATHISDGGTSRSIPAFASLCSSYDQLVEAVQRVRTHVAPGVPVSPVRRPQTVATTNRPHAGLRHRADCDGDDAHPPATATPRAVESEPPTEALPAGGAARVASSASDTDTYSGGGGVDGAAPPEPDGTDDEGDDSSDSMIDELEAYGELSEAVFSVFTEALSMHVAAETLKLDGERWFVDDVLGSVSTVTSVFCNDSWRLFSGCDDPDTRAAVVKQVVVTVPMFLTLTAVMRWSCHVAELAARTSPKPQTLPTPSPSGEWGNNNAAWSSDADSWTGFDEDGFNCDAHNGGGGSARGIGQGGSSVDETVPPAAGSDQPSQPPVGMAVHFGGSGDDPVPEPHPPPDTADMAGAGESAAAGQPSNPSASHGAAEVDSGGSVPAAPPSPTAPCECSVPSHVPHDPPEHGAGDNHCRAHGSGEAGTDDGGTGLAVRGSNGGNSVPPESGQRPSSTTQSRLPVHGGTPTTETRQPSALRRRGGRGARLAWPARTR